MSYKLKMAGVTTLMFSVTSVVLASNPLTPVQPSRETPSLGQANLPHHLMQQKTALQIQKAPPTPQQRYNITLNGRTTTFEPTTPETLLKNIGLGQANQQTPQKIFSALKGHARLVLGPNQKAQGVLFSVDHHNYFVKLSGLKTLAAKTGSNSVKSFICGVNCPCAQRDADHCVITKGLANAHPAA